MSAAHDDEPHRRAAREAGLERLLEQDPALIGRAVDLARGYAGRLERPASPWAEPAHVYRPKREP